MPSGPTRSRTYHVSGGSQVILEVIVANTSSNAQCAGFRVDRVRAELTQVDFQAVLEFAQCRGESMALGGGEEGDSMLCCKFDLIGRVSTVHFDLTMEVIVRGVLTAFATSASLMGLMAAEKLGASVMVHRLVAFSKVLEPGKEMTVPGDHLFPGLVKMALISGWRRLTAYAWASHTKHQNRVIVVE